MSAMGRSSVKRRIDLGGLWCGAPRGVKAEASVLGGQDDPYPSAGWSAYRWRDELHQHPLADQEGRAVGADDHDLDHALATELLGRVVRTAASRAPKTAARRITLAGHDPGGDRPRASRTPRSGR